MAVERRLHDAALHAAAAAVDEAHLAQAGLGRGVDVLVDHRRDIARRERVQVELGFDRDMERIQSDCLLPIADTRGILGCRYGFDTRP